MTYQSFSIRSDGAVTGTLKNQHSKSDHNHIQDAMFHGEVGELGSESITNI